MDKTDNESGVKPTLQPAPAPASRSLADRASMALATCFGLGHVRPGPGTWASAAAVLFAWPLHAVAGPWGLAVACIFVTVLGISVAARHQRITGRKDAPEIVIDEVAGQWLALLFVAFSPLAALAGFLLFRCFDILKPWPIGFLDRRIGGGLGVMLDDLAAGVAAGSCLWLLAWLEWL